MVAEKDLKSKRRETVRVLRVITSILMCYLCVLV